MSQKLGTVSEHHSGSLTKLHSGKSPGQSKDSGTIAISPRISRRTASQKFSTFRSSSFISAGATYLEKGCIRLECGFGMNQVEATRLKVVPIFSRLSDIERGKLGAVLIQKKFRDGETVIQEDAIGEGLYIIRYGKAKVQRRDPRTRIVGMSTGLTKYDHFGEGAQLKNVARGATVIAHGSLSCWFLGNAMMSKLFSQSASSAINSHFPRRNAVGNESSGAVPGASKKKSQRVTVTRKDSFMIQQLDTSKLTAKKPKSSSEVKSILLTGLSDILLFSSMSSAQKENVVDLMQRHPVAENVIVVREGEIGSHLYIVVQGEFGMYRNVNVGEKVETLKSGGHFGALALMHEITRDFTVKASGHDNIIYSLDRVSFRAVVAEHASEKLNETIEFLKNVEYLRPLDASVLGKVAETVQIESYTKGQEIIANGQKPEALYIIVDGKVTENTHNDTGDIELAKELSKGEFFGEGSLLEKEQSDKWKRTSMQCASSVMCLKLDKQTFNLISEPIKELLAQRKKRESQPEIAKEPESKQEPEQPKQSEEPKAKLSFPPLVEEDEEEEDEDEKEKEKKPQWGEGHGKENIKREDLNVLGFLGQGSYGHVQLVQHKKTKETYALKGVMKREIVECNQIAHIVSEKRVMMILDSPFILKLFATYKDANCVYFLLECSLGGELFNVLRARTLLDEGTAKYYVASVILAFEFMHSKNIIYRDLKPENILLDSKGYAKVADFGFAKELSPEEGYRTFTLCGTPDYLAPEVIMGTGHGFGFDWWCVGILIYELLAGWPPFMDNGGEVMKTYENIVQFNLRWPAHLSNNSISIMCEFMKESPHERLGMTKGGISAIKRQPWFRGFNWEGLENGTLVPPVNPNVKNNKDLSNFDNPEDGKIHRDPEIYTATPGDYIWEDEF